MLVAVSDEARRIVASTDAKEKRPRCPDCAACLVVRQPANRVPHFAHRPHERCNAPGKRRTVTRVVERPTIEGQGVLFDLVDDAADPRGS